MTTERVPAGPAAVDRIAALLAERPPSAGITRVVAIDGRAGAGKSTLAHALAERLAAPVVALEELYGGWDGLDAGIDRVRDTVLTPLADGRPAMIAEHDWWQDRWRPPRALPPPEVLILEGVGAGAVRLRDRIALTVWVEVPEPVRRERALRRDDGLFTPYWSMWAGQEDALLAREPGWTTADVVVDGLAALPADASAGAAVPVAVVAAGAPGAAVRHIARVLLIDDEQRVLLMEQRDPGTGGAWWSAPGGGVEPGESAHAAAVREVWEETGLRDVALGPEVWRTGSFGSWGDALLESRERWWIAHVDGFEPRPALLSATEADELIGFRWWTVAELRAERPATDPLDLVDHLAELLRDGPPAQPQYLPG